MSAINEAYARIDLAAIQKIENDIEEIKKVIRGYPFLYYEENEISTKATSILADRIRMGPEQKSIQLRFPTNWFSDIPVVTATVENVDGKLINSDDITVVIRKITARGVSIIVRRTQKVPVNLNVVAIGRKGRSFYNED